MPPRRIVAIVLPKLACEIAKSRAEVKGPIAILFDPIGAPSRERSHHQMALFEPEFASRPTVKESAIIGAVSDEARRYGVRPGQRVTEATALVARLNVLTVTFAEIDRALGRVAEVAMAFGTTAAIQLSKGGVARGGKALPSSADAPARDLSRTLMLEERSPTGDGPFDTVWLDITGAAHLHGDEESLLDALGERVSALGHTVHLAIADGPRIAQSLARWGVSEKGHLIAAEGRGALALAPLPIRAMPLPPDRIAFLLRVGVLTIGDLVKLPKAEVNARLGTRGATALAVASGIDPTPLVPFAPPPVLEEEVLFEDSVHTVEPLLFVLRGASSRLSARLEARGEACTRLDVELPYDASIARRALAERGEPITQENLREHFHVDLPAPLYSAADLFRVVRTRLERTSLIAPVHSIKISISEIARARKTQLDFARDAHADPNSLPSLLAELSAEIGPDCLGTLARCDSLRPEGKSTLIPVKNVESPAGEIPTVARDPMCPSRLLHTPISLGRAGSAVVAVTGQLYVIERRRFLARLDDVEWWSDKPCSRDYFRATLSSGTVPQGVRGNSGTPPRSVVSDALIFIDPRTEETFLQGWFE
ncbi:MAG: DNA polymerase Y family protein [Polyangiaceae bacterium]|nr:DNA polymerase Y family protein [Polyangiaceae bacterium]